MSAKMLMHPKVILGYLSTPRVWDTKGYEGIRGDTKKERIMR